MSNIEQSSREPIPGKRVSKHPGAGRPNELTDPIRLQMVIETEMIMRVDAIRGSKSRSDWIRAAVRNTLAQHDYYEFCNSQPEIENF